MRLSSTKRALLMLQNKNRTVKSILEDEGIRMRMTKNQPDKGKQMILQYRNETMSTETGSDVYNKPKAET